MARYLLTKGRPSVQERSLGKGVPPFSGNLAQLRLRRIGLQGSSRDRVLAVIERWVRGILIACTASFCRWLSSVRGTTHAIMR